MLVGCYEDKESGKVKERRENRRENEGKSTIEEKGLHDSRTHVHVYIYSYVCV